jgi:hypothetical protein
MVDRRRDEFDELLERALKRRVFSEAPSDTVWENIILEVSGRDQQYASRREHLAEWISEAVIWASGLAATARIMLTPSPLGFQEEWADALMVAGHMSVPLHYSIHR